MVKSGEEGLTKYSSLFLGEYEPNLTKGYRLALPKKIRDAVGSDTMVILTRGIDGCITGYSKDFWEKEAAKNLNSSLDDKRSRLLKRYIFSGAFEVEYDSQGRIILPRNLAINAGITLNKSQTILIGAGDHFEIWNKENWLNALKMSEKELL